MISVVSNVLFAALLQVPATEGLPVLRPGDVIVGAVVETDPVIRTDILDELSDAPVHGKTYRIERGEAGPFFIELRSHLFDAYLVLRDLDGEPLLEDDDGLLSTHSRIVVAAVAPRTAFVDVCSLGGTGAFQVLLSHGEPEDLSALDRLENALADARESVRIREETLGPEHPGTAASLNNLAGLLVDQGAYEEARPLFERALPLTEASFGPEHANTAFCLGNFAQLLQAQGAYDEAQPYYERSLRIRESTLGADHPATAATLNNLARLHIAQGAYEAAQPLLERALLIREAALGSEHPDTASTLSNLALVLDDRGADEEARILYERALRITEASLGPEHPGTATILGNLAWLHRDQGAYEEARPLFERALRISERTLGPDHPDTAIYLNNLAELLQDQEMFEEARPLYERALRIREAALGSEHPNTLISLNNLALLLQDQGAYEKARPLFERALRISEKTLSPDHPDTAIYLTHLASLLHDLEMIDEARPLSERALRITETTLGPEHPRTASSLNNLASLLQDQGAYEKARPLFERALRIWETEFGPEHPRTAMCLDNLASLLKDQGAYEEARPLSERALRILETTLGPEHPRTATSLNNLASLLQDRGAYEEARTLYERALRILQGAYGLEHHETASCLNNLALSLKAQGAYEEARPYSERALRILETTHGPEHPRTATILSNLAGLLRAQGAYEEARPLYERALRILERTLGPEHSRTAACVNGLALLLHDQGAYEEARLFYERALRIRETALGPEHPRTATSLNNLGVLLRDQGAYEEARPLYERALRIRETSLGPEHPTTAQSVNSLALLLHDQGSGEEVLPQVERALRITEATLGSEHPETAACLTVVAYLLKSQGAYEEARLLFERSLRIREAAFGPDHPSTTTILGYLALLEFDLGKIEAALLQSKAALVGVESHAERMLWSLSEAERLRHIRRARWHLGVLLSLARTAGSVASTNESYEAVLGWKGRVARSLLRGGLREVRSLPKAERAVVIRLRALQTKLSDALYLTEIRDSQAHARQLKELRSQHNRLEVDLARLRGKGKASAEGSRFEPLAAAVPKDAVAIDFLVHHSYEPDSWEEGDLARKGRWTEPHLSAWVVRGEQSVRHLDLGAAAVVKEAVSGFLEEMALRRGVAPAVADSSGLTANNDNLRALLWDPLAEVVGDARTVYLSGDSFLGTLPFETLRREDGSFLIEHHAFAYLSDMQSLVDLLSTRGRIEPQLLVVGGIDFRKRADVPEDASQLIVSEDVRGGLMNRWPPLSGTSVEADAIADLFDEATDGAGDALLLKSLDATEEAIKRSIAGKTHVHFATHGFFQPKGLPSAWKNIKEQNDAAFTLLRETEQSVAGYLPGLLSGLVFAGANLDHEPGRDNGLLTAEEVTYLDLKDCDLVVLSACETGLGRPEGGEGMIGLRRAFRMAGARTVISSLWRTGDESAQRLMTEFYENLWLRGMSKLDALRSAQLAMLKRNQEEYGRAIPATWGVFVLDGAPE